MKYFIGFEVPVAEREQLWGVQTKAAQKLSFEISQGSAPLHLTLVPPFLVANRKEDEELQRGLSVAIHRLRAQTITLVGIGSFEEHTVFAGVSEEQRKAIAAFRRDLHFYLDRKDSYEKSFVPHVSLARHFEPRHFVAVERALRAAAGELRVLPLSFEAGSFTLFRNEGKEWERTTTYGLREQRAA